MIRTPPRVNRKEGEDIEAQRPKKILRAPVSAKLASTHIGAPTEGEHVQTCVGTAVSVKQGVAERSVLLNQNETSSVSTRSVRQTIFGKMPSVCNTDRGDVAGAIEQLDAELWAIKLIIKEMEVAIKKQPNVSRAIKDSLPKLEEKVDKLQYLSKTWPNPSQSNNALTQDGSPTETEKRGAASETSSKEEPSEHITQAHEEWVTVTHKKGSTVEKKSVTKKTDCPDDRKDSNKKKKNKGVQKRERPNAILLKPAEGQSYAEVLNSVRTKVNPDSCGVQVKSLRKTRGGELLVELQKASSESRNAFQLALKEAAGESSEVRELTSRTKLEIRDIDDYSSQEEVKASLINTLKDYYGFLEVSLTKANERGQRIAIANMETEAAKKLLQLAKVKVGWVNCSIRRRVEVLRCFKCLNYGHLGSACQGPDRSSLCFKCGQDGHRARDCKAQIKCYLCTDEDSRNHLAGSGACSAFRKALAEVKRNK